MASEFRKLVQAKLNDPEAQIAVTAISDLRQCVREARDIYVDIRFGLSEKTVRLAKNEALLFLDSIPSDTTPEEHEMSTGKFGWYYPASRALFLG